MPRSLTLNVAVGVVCLGFTMRAVETAAAAPAASTLRAPASTNAAPTSPDLPKSIFVVPATSQEGRDPFFPQSTRLRPVTRVTATAPPQVVAELELKGISGTASRRLAIINNRTFESGEEGDVVANGNRVRVKCGEILADSVRVTANGREQELHLHTKF